MTFSIAKKSVFCVLLASSTAFTHLQANYNDSEHLDSEISILVTKTKTRIRNEEGIQNWGFRMPKVTIKNPVKDIMASVFNPKEFLLKMGRPLAQKAKNSKAVNNYKDCVIVVAAGMAVIGAQQGGPLGAAISAGSGLPTASIVCREIFKTDDTTH